MKIQEIKFKGLNHNYSIFIGSNALGLLTNKIKNECPRTKKIALILDTKVPSKFKKSLKTKLKNYELLILPFFASEKNLKVI